MLIITPTNRRVSTSRSTGNTKSVKKILHITFVCLFVWTMFNEGAYLTKMVLLLSNNFIY